MPTAQPQQPFPPNYGANGGANMQTPMVPETPKRSHKKLLITLIILIVLVAGGTTAFLLLHKAKKATPSASKTTSSSTSKKSTDSFVPASKTACQLFALTDAQTLLGSGTTLNAGNGAEDTTDANEAVTSCAYSSSDPTVANTTVTEGIVDVTGARTAAAAAAFKADLKNLKTQYAGGTDVTGIGDDAYYVPTTQSLNIVDGNYEIIIYAGSLTNGTLTSNMTLAEQIGKVVVGKL